MSEPPMYVTLLEDFYHLYSIAGRTVARLVLPVLPVPTVPLVRFSSSCFSQPKIVFKRARVVATKTVTKQDCFCCLQEFYTLYDVNTVSIYIYAVLFKYCKVQFGCYLSHFNLFCLQIKNLIL
jgi:hypothetical protein